jgi:hypothetical protein
MLSARRGYFVMPVTVSTPDTSLIVNGKPADATPVVAALNTLTTNTNNLKTKVDGLLTGRVEESPTILLNASLTGSPTVDGGVVVNRGASPDVSILWDEGEDRWSFTNNGTDFSTLVTSVELARLQGLSLYPTGPAPQFVTYSTIRILAGTKMLDTTGAVLIEVPSNRTISTATVGALGLDTGSVASDTWYWPYLIEGESGVSALLSANATTPTLPSGYTRYARLPCPVRTMTASTNIMPFVYQGFGTNTLTCLYSAADWNITAGTAVGENVCLNGGTSATYADVPLTLVPVGASQALIAFSARTATTAIKPKLLTQEQVLVSGATDDNFQSTSWVLLDTDRTYQYKVSANNTSHACLGFILQV